MKRNDGLDVEEINNSEDEIVESIGAQDEICDDELLKLQNELSEVTDKFYRASADFENIKKRMEKEKENAVAYANEKFAKDLLPMLDALEEALKIDASDNELAGKIKDGVKQCVSMVLRSFEKYGIEPISTDGSFDPEIHNAINMIEVENAKSGDIVHVYQKGYTYKNRVLRASMVVIAK